MIFSIFQEILGKYGQWVNPRRHLYLKSIQNVVIIMVSIMKKCITLQYYWQDYSLT